MSRLQLRRLPQEDEYAEKISPPETIAGGLNIFNGLVDDSMLEHGQVVSMYVSGKDGQQNQVAMGGGPVCPPTPQCVVMLQAKSCRTGTLMHPHTGFDKNSNQLSI